MRVKLGASSLVWTIVLIAGMFSAGTAADPPSANVMQPANSFGTVFLNAEGVDACSYYSSDTWNKYYLKPNMFGLGFYMGGATADAAGCYEPGSTWLNNLASGWKVIPIWDGYQAPCNTYATQKMSSNVTTAGSQGTAAGNNAVSKSQSDGINAGNIIYLDIEGYPNTCTGPVKAYVNSFVHTLHLNGYQAGIYGSDCGSSMNQYATIANVPDDAWIGNYNGVDDSTTFSCLNSGNWTGGRRIHQYRGDVSDTYNGVTVKVDKDCVNGQVDGSTTYNNACG